MRKKVMALLIVLLGLAWVQTIKAAMAVPAEYREHLEAAEAYAGKEIYEDALEEYRLALKIHPENQEVQLAAARMERALGDKTAFVSSCEALMEGETLYEPALLELVDYYASDGKPGRIVELLKDLRRRNTESGAVEELWKTYCGSCEKMYYSYEELSPFFEGYASAKTAEGYLLIDTDGERVFSECYEAIGFYSSQSDLIPVKKDGAWYYVNGEEHKKIVPDQNYDFLGIVSEDCAVAGKEGSYTYIDRNGQPQTDQSWEAATNLLHHTAAVCENGSWRLVNQKFEPLTDTTYEDIATDEMGFCSESERIFARQADGWHLLDTEGAEVTSVVYEDAKAFGRDGLAAVCEKGSWGYINAEGETVIPCRYEDAGRFQEGFAPVCQNGLWGFIDRDGEMVIEPAYEAAYPFCAEGVAPVKEGSWFLIRLYAL